MTDEPESSKMLPFPGSKPGVLVAIAGDQKNTRVFECGGRLEIWIVGDSDCRNLLFFKDGAVVGQIVSDDMSTAIANDLLNYANEARFFAALAMFQIIELTSKNHLLLTPEFEGATQ